MKLPATELLRVAALTCLAMSMAGCATTETRSPGDPFEPANRGVFEVNRAIDRAALKPAAKAYVKVTPSWFRIGVGNFFNNLSVPYTALNQVLQGKFVAAGQDTLRFAINTTLGWGGVLDVAAGAHLPEHEEDLGQTLGKWGVPPGPFLMLPLVGPSTVRDFPSVVAERVLAAALLVQHGQRQVGLTGAERGRRPRPIPGARPDSRSRVRQVHVRSRRFPAAPPVPDP